MLANLLRYVSYLREYKALEKRFISCFPQNYKNIIKFHNPKTMDEAIINAKLCQNHIKQRFESHKNCQRKPKEKYDLRKRNFRTLRN